MEQIVHEGINTKKKQQSEGIFEDLMKTKTKQKKTEKSCPINLSGKCVDMVADCSIVLFSTLRRQVFLKFLATGGANRL